jgi:FKBP-type peptidyl-prolyl cis-trans isomerase
MLRATQGLAIVAASGLAVVLAIAVSAQPSTPSGGGPAPLPAMVQWHTTPSGLKYVDTLLGNGPEPHDGQTVVVHFTGWLADGMQFDSTRDRQKPFGFQLGSHQVIKGWDEGVRGMRAGGKRRLIVPPALGYGPKGLGPIVPPDATLTFDIELLRIIGS